MIMIIGGYNQGKTSYAKNHYENADERIFYLNDWVKALDKDEEPEAIARRFIAEHPDMICITDEVGKGLVPADRGERLFREKVGRIQISLAEKADEVIHVTCGIGRKIK